MRDVFKKGYYYKFKNGRAFYVKDICFCSQCESRGLHEPVVMWLDDCNDGWRADYLTEYCYDQFVNDIEIESDRREKWVNEYIANTIELKRKNLEEEIEEYLNSWQ